MTEVKSYVSHIACFHDFKRFFVVVFVIVAGEEWPKARPTRGPAAAAAVVVVVGVVVRAEAVDQVVPTELEHTPFRSRGANSLKAIPISKPLLRRATN